MVGHAASAADHLGAWGDHSKIYLIPRFILTDGTAYASFAYWEHAPPLSAASFTGENTYRICVIPRDYHRALNACI